jgi:hypothetical protein
MHGPLHVEQFTAIADENDDDYSYIQSFTRMPVTVKPISPVKQQFVVTHTIRRTEIPASPRSWVTNTPSVKMWRAQKKFHTNMLKRWSTEDRSESFVFPVQLCVGGVECV